MKAQNTVDFFQKHGKHVILISFTPRTPRLKVFLLVLLATSFFKISKAQDLSIVPFDSLEKSLKLYIHEISIPEAKEIFYQQKGQWLNYMPSIGVSPVIRQNGGFSLAPSVSININRFFEVGEKRKLKALKAEAHEVKYRLKFNSELQRLKLEYEKYKIEKGRIEDRESEVKIENQILEIHKEAYAKKDMSPLEFLQKKRAFIKVKNGVKEMRRKLYLIKLSIYQLAHYKMKLKDWKIYAYERF